MTNEPRPQPSKAQKIAELFDAFAQVLFYLGVLALLAPFLLLSALLLMGLTQ